MAITLSNGVNNVNATPGINSNTFANRPAATDVAVGSIYIATDTGTIYQSNGATWSTLGGGGGPTPTPGIDDVLSVNQALTAPQVIEMNGNTLFFQDGGANAFQFFTDGDIQIGKPGEDRFNFQIFPGYSDFYLEEPSIGSNNLYISSQTGSRFYKLGDYAIRDNGNCFNILDSSDQVFLQNKGITTGFYFDFGNKLYKFGRLNNTSEQSIEIDEVNSFTYAKDNGVKNGFNLDFSATVFQFGFLDNTVIPDTYININGNNETIQAVYNGLDNGLNINFNIGSRLFQFGDYQNIYNGSNINIDDNANTILIKGNQNNGYIEFESRALRFQSPNLLGAFSVVPTGDSLLIELNGVQYAINLYVP